MDRYTTWDSWQQGSLLPMEVVEIRVRIGIVPASDHLQWMVELVEPTTGIQRAMTGCPHRPLARAGEELVIVAQLMADLLEDAVPPF